MANNDNSFLFSKRDTSADMRNDDADKRGAGSFCGIFSLLSELDYFKLIEKLIRKPVTKDQVVTSNRWWLFGKGTKPAGLAGVLLFAVRFGILGSGDTIDPTVKFGVYLLFYFLLLFAFPYMFLQYLKLPDGVTWSATIYTLQGFTFGLLMAVVGETALMFGTLYARSWVVANWYHKSKIGDPLLELWYDSICRSYVEEGLLFLASLVCVYFVWRYVAKFGEIRRLQLATGKPYDLIK